MSWKSFGIFGSVLELFLDSETVSLYDNVMSRRLLSMVSGVARRLASVIGSVPRQSVKFCIVLIFLLGVRGFRSFTPCTTLVLLSHDSCFHNLLVHTMNPFFLFLYVFFPKRIHNVKLHTLFYTSKTSKDSYPSFEDE